MAQLSTPRGDASLSSPRGDSSQSKHLDDHTKVKGLFRGKHLFVELHEFRGTEWEETHRWNHGLQEDLLMVRQESCDSNPEWTGPHLPSISLFGLSSLHTSLTEELVILDLDVGCFESCLRVIADAALERMVQLGKCPDFLAVDAAENLHEHMERRKVARGKHSDIAGLEAWASSGKQNTVPKRKFKLGIVDQVLHGGDPGGSEDIDAQYLDYITRVHSDDALRPNVEEESVQILIDNVDWIDEDVTCIVRLSEAIQTGLEEFSRGGAPTTRFVVLILGPLDDVGKCEKNAVNKRQVEMGEATAALLQDDAVVQAVYRAKSPKDVIQAFEQRLWNLRLMPNTTRPTYKALEKRATRMMETMETVRREEDILKREASTIDMLMSQNQRWLAKQNLFSLKGKLSLNSFFGVMQKLAVPLITGITLGLVWANTEDASYSFWAGSGHGDSSASGASGGDAPPTIFGLSVHGHFMTPLFLVNDIGMCFFFGLAAKEICEALQPGGSLYPPTRSTVNVLAATLGGVLGPIAVYMLLTALVASMGLLEPGFGFADYAVGWGIPTATDISLAWVTAVVCFGRGHPAINYLLLLAIIDDGIGLMIIAFAYPDKSNPFTPSYLVLVLAAMLVAFVLRRLKCARWQIYVFVAGPLAWLGLLYAALHPALALVFVVPFMPLEIKSPETMDISFVFRSMAALPVEEEGHDDSHHHKLSPLHDFEEATKNFVDFGVLFAFGCVNAGVQVGSVGALTAVVFVSLVVGKTAGITLASSIASFAHCPPPSGMSMGSVAGVGFIASAGLTVALFVCGEAFTNEPELDGQAKMGALLSISVAIVAVGFAKVAPKFGLTGQENHEPDPEFQIRRESSDFSDEMATDDIITDYNSGRKPRGEEPLERAIVDQTIKELVMMHKVTKAVESKYGMTQMEASVKAGRIYEKKKTIMEMEESGGDAATKAENGNEPSSLKALRSGGSSQHASKAAALNAQASLPDAKVVAEADDEVSV